MAQAMMWLSFVMVPLPGLKLKWQIILSINPVFGIVDAFRAATFGHDFRPISFAISSVMTIGLFVLGLFYFRKTERRFADIA
jgi:lipopolysaccharide transport system permease protein